VHAGTRGSGIRLLDLNVRLLIRLNTSYLPIGPAKILACPTAQPVVELPRPMTDCSGDRFN
jgi:hypothetical protein